MEGDALIQDGGTDTSFSMPAHFSQLCTLPSWLLENAGCVHLLGVFNEHGTYAIVGYTSVPIQYLMEGQQGMDLYCRFSFNFLLLAAINALIMLHTKFHNTSTEEMCSSIQPGRLLPNTTYAKQTTMSISWSHFDTACVLYNGATVYISMDIDLVLIRGFFFYLFQVVQAPDISRRFNLYLLKPATATYSFTAFCQSLNISLQQLLTRSVWRAWEILLSCEYAVIPALHILQFFIGDKLQTSHFWLFWCSFTVLNFGLLLYLDNSAQDTRIIVSSSHQPGHTFPGFHSTTQMPMLTK